MALSTQWRIYITETVTTTSGYIGLAEIEMADEPGGVNLCTDGIILYNNQHGSFSASKAFDGDKANYGWITNSVPAPGYIGYQFPEAVQIREIRIWGNDPVNLSGDDHNPRDFVLQYYDDELANWADSEAVYTNEPSWSAYELRTYVGDLSVVTYYKIEGIVTRGNNFGVSRTVYVHDQSTWELLRTIVSDNSGVFSVVSAHITPDPVILRIPDPEGKYNTIVRENIVPIEIV